MGGIAFFYTFFNLIFCFWIVDNWDFVCCIFRLVCQQNSSLNFYDKFAMILLIDRFSCCFCCKFEFSVLASQFLGKLKCKFLCVSVVFYFLSSSLIRVTCVRKDPAIENVASPCKLERSSEILLFPDYKYKFTIDLLDAIFLRENGFCRYLLLKTEQFFMDLLYGYFVRQI